MEQPLLVSSSPAPPSPASDDSPGFLIRLLLLVAVAAFSLWANYEASKSFQVTVLNNNAAAASVSSSPPTRRFDLLFVANGRAARLVHRAADSVQRALYPDASFPRKPVERVTLSMEPVVAADHGDCVREETVAVRRGRREGEFAVELRPRVMAAADVAEAVGGAVRRGVARVWLWDGQGRAPKRVLAALEDYLATSSADALRGASLASQSRNHSAATVLPQEDFVCVARLNRAMKDGWDDRMLTEACASIAA
ncbi:uncharacterized protein LOC122019505 [Zingiber officinale]|uniref:Uncharacterized protein n=1 Tax=Zingiber officinale TaxID=94328 RepID=A0A8J5F4R5_ZINOF|nr:uncharacterized protein LOC122019505 [Zingiber officinale]KAG6479910.1 hypothetical protein ZIOFF_063386 [Zingiber officinale]